MKIYSSPIVQRLAAGMVADVSAMELVTWLWNAPTLVLMAVASGIAAIGSWLCLRYIPHTRVGVVEKLWSPTGSVGEGHIIALNGEAGYQAELLRGGIHFGYWRWQYRVHKVRLIVIPEGEVGYAYSRDGQPLEPSHFLGRCVPSNNFQNAREFLTPGNAQLSGQRGRQRSLLGEGVYAINPALFVVITNSNVFALRQIQEPQEIVAVTHWQKELQQLNGFRPMVVGGQMVCAAQGEHDEIQWVA